MRMDPFERGLAVIRLDNAIPVFLEKFSSQAAHDLVVLYEQNRSALPFPADGLSFNVGFASNLVFRAREIDLERCSLAGFTVNHYVSRALLDDAIYRGQAQTSSFAGFFGGKERLEDARHGSLVHAAPSVADRKHDVFSWRYGVLLLGKGLVEFNGASFENKLAATRHGIAGIHREVDHDLVKLA